jgi:hypothetical protein
MLDNDRRKGRRGAYRRRWFNFNSELFLLKVFECELHSGYTQRCEGDGRLGWIEGMLLSRLATAGQVGR